MLLAVRIYTTLMYCVRCIGLQKYGMYAATIAAKTMIGRGPISNALEFRTNEDGRYYSLYIIHPIRCHGSHIHLLPVVPGPPKNISLKLINATSVLLTWAKPDNPNGEIIEYQVNYSGYRLISEATGEVR